MDIIKTVDEDQSNVYVNKNEIYISGQDQVITFVVSTIKDNTSVSNKVVMDNAQFINISYSKDIRKIGNFGYPNQYMVVTTNGNYLGAIQFVQNQLNIFGILSEFAYDNILWVKELTVHLKAGQYTIGKSSNPSYEVVRTTGLVLRNVMLSKPGFTLVPTSGPLLLVSYFIQEDLNEI